MKIGEKIEIDLPGNRCFGCGPTNPIGLNLEFFRTGEHSVATEFTASPDHCGAEGVIHGGIQATLLDEVLGVAIRTLVPPGVQPGAVTAEFKLRYRKPALVGEPMRVEGEFVRGEGRNRFVEGRILDAAGNLLTVAEARWVVVDPPA